MKEPAAAGPAIRTATPSDIPALGRFGAQLMALHHQWDRERFIPAKTGTADAYADWLSGQLRQRDVIILVSEVDGILTGYTYAGLEGYDYMSLRGPAGVVHDIFVDSSARNRGVGGMLLDAVVAELTARGTEQVVLSTAYRNEAAQRLFAAAGFRPTMMEMTRTGTSRSAKGPSSPGTRKDRSS
ncbi:GNAT family N-acetyltransferase [Rhizobium sp. 0TCS1.26]|uniref:GNAT family N-acetyltransferase n=1 Tax=Rhizobium sp. 0TCS1.26 TaxID=3142623 RepID=UPI003D2D79AE